MENISVKDIENAFREICSEEELQPYVYIGNGLYRFSNGAISNKKGVELYIELLHKHEKIMADN